jgi:MFS family permease
VDRQRVQAFPLYLGGFMGPFGGGLLAVLIPQLRDAFHASTGAVAAGIPAYIVPFALLQLVSGTIGERLGRRRVVRTAYIVYAIASVAAALSPSIGVFLALRATQGCANAFVTPLLLAGLAEITPARRLGEAVGTFAAVQTAAIALSPLCGGLAGAVDWRIAFFFPAAVTVALAFFPPPDATRRAGAGPARLRSAFTRRVGVLSAAAFAAYAGVTGLGFLVALRCSDAFGLGSTTRGLVLASFGVAGMLAGRAGGQAVDRFGRVAAVIVGSLVCAAVVAALGVAGSAGETAALWFVAGAGSTVAWAGLNTLAVEAVPSNRAGATSVVSALKFAGNAAAPVIWLPLYDSDPRLAFVAAGAMAAITALLVLPLRGIEMGRRPPARAAAEVSPPLG